MDPAWTTFLMETADRELAAFAQVSRDTELVTPAIGHAEVRRFYVDARWHGQGVAARLMETVLAEATGWGAKALVLGVWEHNPRGIAFYRKVGFHPVGQTIFDLGGDLQTDLVFRRPLTADA